MQFSSLDVDMPVILPHERALKRAAGFAPYFSNAFEGTVMAKPATVKIRLVSSADTGFFYVTKKIRAPRPRS